MSLDHDIHRYVPAPLIPGGDDGYPQYAGRFAVGLHLAQPDGLDLAWRDGAAAGTGSRSAFTVDLADHVAVALACNADTVNPNLRSIAVQEAWLEVWSSITPTELAAH